MLDSRELAPDRYALISVLLALHEEAPELDETGVGQRAVELAEEVTGSRAGYLHVVEKGGGIRLAAWSQRTLSSCTSESETHYALDQAGIWADCVREGRPVVHNELDAGDYRRGLPQGHTPLLRHLAVPVLEQGRPVMVLGVGNKREPYGDEDIDRVRLLAESAWGLLRRKAHEQREARHLEFLEANMLATIDVVSTIVSMGGRLTLMEREIARTHARQGYEILRKSRFSWPLADVVLQHHEHYDGSGYPDGLRGEAILLEARIISVADVVEAMSSQRPHRPPRSIDSVLAEVEAGAGTRYDPRVAASCLRLFREQGYSLPGS